MTSISIFVSAFKDADTFGKLIFFTLFALSFFSWFILLYKGRQYYRLEKEMDLFLKSFQDDKDPLLEKSFSSLVANSPLFHLYHRFRDTSEELIERNCALNRSQEHFLTTQDLTFLHATLKEKIQETGKTLNQNLFILATSTSLAPFLGILGTVWGLLISLSGLGKGGSTLSNQVVMGGLSTALATTVIGLLIAIPALVGYNYLRSRQKEIQGTMVSFSSHLLHEIELSFRRS